MSDVVWILTVRVPIDGLVWMSFFVGRWFDVVVGVFVLVS